MAEPENQKNEIQEQQHIDTPLPVSVATVSILKQNKASYCNFCFLWYDTYQGADKSLARPTSQCILFDGENISFDASLVIYI